MSFVPRSSRTMRVAFAGGLAFWLVALVAIPASAVNTGDIIVADRAWYSSINSLALNIFCQALMDTWT